VPNNLAGMYCVYPSGNGFILLAERVDT